MAILISSFHNEEYLLPWWLNHHKDLFDHGVLFDYFSTDRSVEIIKEICPTWEIYNTNNKDWNFKDNDREYMEAERKYLGYKIVLTTTEFLMGYFPPLKEEPTAYKIPIFRLVDDQPEIEPTYDKPLVIQKRHGFMDTGDRHRFLHNYPDGQYGVGRHKTSLKTTPCGLTINKFVYSPWTEEFIQRKLNMKKYIDPKDVERKWGLHHTWDRERLEKERLETLRRGKWI